jgi:hypothetical protein
MMQFIGLWRHLKEAEVERVTEAGRLTILVRGVSIVLVDLGMPPAPGIPLDLCTADDILEATGTIFECLWDTYASGHGPRD